MTRGLGVVVRKHGGNGEQGAGNRGLLSKRRVLLPRKAKAGGAHGARAGKRGRVRFS